MLDCTPCSPLTLLSKPFLFADIPTTIKAWFYESITSLSLISPCSFCLSYYLTWNPSFMYLARHVTAKGLQRAHRARVVQWWERSPPTNVARVRILASTPYVGWVCCWFSPLLREVFLRVLRFSPLLKNQHFQIPIWSERTDMFQRVFMNSFVLHG